MVGVDDCAVVEAVWAQPVEIVLADVCGGERQLAGVGKQRCKAGLERVQVAGDDRLRQRSVT